MGDIYFISTSRVNLGIHQTDVSVVWDLGPHDFSILRYWLDENPIAVSAASRGCVIPGKPDVAFINLEFPSGVIAHVELSWLAPSKLRRTTIVGSSQMIVYDDTSSEPVRMFDSGVVFPNPGSFGEYQLSYRTGSIVSPRIDASEPLMLEMQDFCTAISDRLLAPIVRPDRLRRRSGDRGGARIARRERRPGRGRDGRDSQCRLKRPRRRSARLAVGQRQRRLCMVVHGPYPIGEPRVAREVAAALAAGYEVDVVAMRRSGEPSRESVDGADVVRLPLSHQRGTGLLGMVAEYVGFTALASGVVAKLMLRRRYSVVQIHNPPDFLIVAGLVPRALGAYVIFDVHDLSSDMFAMRWAGKPGARIAERLLRAIERAATSLADAVVTVHEPYRRELAARGVPAGKLTVVMNTLDESLLPRRSAPRDEQTFRIVYHGTVTPLYGVPLLVEACALIARPRSELQAGDLRRGRFGRNRPPTRDRARDRRPSAGQRGVPAPP